MANRHTHALTCRPAKRQRTNELDDEEPVRQTVVFKPVIEQVSGHLVKKCSIFIRRAGYIEDAIKKVYQSVRLMPNTNGIGYFNRLTK